MIDPSVQTTAQHLDFSPFLSYMCGMRMKDDELSGRLRSSFPWMMPYSVTFAAGLMLAISWITVAAVFLTHSEIKEISADSASVMKLVAGAALLFLSGIYFMQQFAGRQIQNQAETLYDRNASALASMRKAMDAHLEREAGDSSQRDRSEA
jgi:hypothetical protein